MHVLVLFVVGKERALGILRIFMLRVVGSDAPDSFAPYVYFKSWNDERRWVHRKEAPKQELGRMCDVTAKQLPAVGCALSNPTVGVVVFGPKVSDQLVGFLKRGTTCEDQTFTLIFV